jgi:hypothetical protein
VTTASSDIQAFLYRVLATNQTLGLAATGEDSGAPVISSFSESAQEQARFMSDVYALLYCLENSVREMVESTLRESIGDDQWWDVGVDLSIRKSAEKRKLEDAKERWHGPRGESILSYVDFPQYAEIIDAQWDSFEPLLGDRAWVAYYFAEMNRTRRALAHTGSLSPVDVERMELRVREWLQVVG